MANVFFFVPFFIKLFFFQFQDCFILDTGSVIYVWVGKGATQQEKTQSITRAQSMKRYSCSVSTIGFNFIFCFLK